MDKEYFRDMLQGILEAHGVDWTIAEEVIESIIERCDEEGMFELMPGLGFKEDGDE